MRLYIIILVAVATVSCSVNKKEIETSSSAICGCFTSFSEDDANEMLKTVACLDSVKEILPIESIPKNKLEKELNKSCAISKDHLKLLFN